MHDVIFTIGVSGGITLDPDERFAVPLPGQPSMMVQRLYLDEAKGYAGDRYRVTGLALKRDGRVGLAKRTGSCAPEDVPEPLRSQVRELILDALAAVGDEARKRILGVAS